ncbi:MAG: 5'/3'-nucleotidase SurE [Chloroflexi bacterium]|nr:5'/3'-nucleotidase SurE [Chloroflexota bacterium]
MQKWWVAGYNARGDQDNRRDLSIVNILLTNDDGIYAPGLWAAVEALEGIGKVVVVAPDREQSGVGGSVTLNSPVRAREIVPSVVGTQTWAVEGTPADSVILALESLVKDADLVIAGINGGANLGEDILISGTVGAALQGYTRGLTAIAISLASLRPVGYEAGARLVQVLAQQAREGALPRPALLNVNLPPVPVGQLQGVDITRLARRTYADTVRKGDDGKNGFYWITRTRPAWEMVEGTDVWSLRHRRVSITPLQTDLTAHDAVPGLAHLCGRLSTLVMPSAHLAPS